MNDDHGYPILWSEPTAENVTPAWSGPAPDAPVSQDNSAFSAPAPVGTGSMAGAWSAFGQQPAHADQHADSAAEASFAFSQENVSHITPAPGQGVPQPSQVGIEPVNASHAQREIGNISPAGAQPIADNAEPVDVHGESAPVGWAGASGQTAEEISQASRDESGYGWSQAPSGPQFAAPDAPAPSGVTANFGAAPAGAEHNDFDASAAYPQPVDHSSPGGFDSEVKVQPDAPASAVPFAQDEAAPAGSTGGSSAVSQPSAGYTTGGQFSSADSGSTPDAAAPSAPEAPAAAPASYTSAPQSGLNAPASAPAAAASADSQPQVPEVIANNDKIDDETVTIGRSRENTIVLDDMLVSRRHVVIMADDEGLLLRDVGSRNGTFVNGRRVEQTHLQEGDRIGIGASTFEVQNGWLLSV